MLIRMAKCWMEVLLGVAEGWMDLIPSHLFGIVCLESCVYMQDIVCGVDYGMGACYGPIFVVCQDVFIFVNFSVTMLRRT